MSLTQNKKTPRPCEIEDIVETRVRKLRVMPCILRSRVLLCSTCVVCRTLSPHYSRYLFFEKTKTNKKNFVYTWRFFFIYKKNMSRI